MPVKILLADKSITIQKVVEMLFSGKEYEVTCVSDGDAAVSEAARIVPDVVLADVDLPRLDGYAFTSRLRETPALAKVPVILMLSRDDVYDAMKGKLAGLADNIAKPFESQDLIGKVKKALLSPPAAAPMPPKPAAEVAPPPKPAAAAPMPSKPAAEVAPSPKPAAAAPMPPRPAAAPPPPTKPVAVPPQPQPPAAEPAGQAKPAVTTPAVKPASEAGPAPKAKEAVPKDIFDIIEEVPADIGAKQAVTPAPEAIAKAVEAEEELIEVEPEYEVEPEIEAGAELPAEPLPQVQSTAPETMEAWEVGTGKREPAPAPPVQQMPEPQVTADAFDTDQLFGREPLPAEAAPTVAEAIPTFDFSEPLPAEAEEALPLGQKAVDEMREGLGLGGEISAAEKHPDIVSFESLDMASRAPHEDYTFAAPEPDTAPPAAAATLVSRVAAAAEPRISAPLHAPEASDEMLRGVAREAIEKIIRDVLEQVAWEVIPDLAERLIREEIERLKAETP